MLRDKSTKIISEFKNYFSPDEKIFQITIKALYIKYLTAVKVYFVVL